MALVEIASLGQTIDRIDESLFYGRQLPKSDLEESTQWIAERQGLPGSYASMFSPTDADLTDGFKVFTGEVISSKVAIEHILGEETCRALILLNVTDPFVRKALHQATLGMLERLRLSEAENGVCGMYCCGKCSVAYWRHIAAGGLDRQEERLTTAMKVLKSLRKGEGQWRRFPFYYTLLALDEIDLPPAVEEMRYAAPVLENYLKRTHQTNTHSERRQILFEDILARC